MAPDLVTMLIPANHIRTGNYVNLRLLAVISGPCKRKNTAINYYEIDILYNIYVRYFFRDPNVTFPLDRFTVRKDTIIVPSGGYVVVEVPVADLGT